MILALVQVTRSQQPPSQDVQLGTSLPVNQAVATVNYMVHPQMLCRCIASKTNVSERLVFHFSSTVDNAIPEVVHAPSLICILPLESAQNELKQVVKQHMPE